MNDFSMKARILPAMEMLTVYNTLNFSYAFNQAQNATAGSTSIASFLCPSDGNIVQRASSHYVGALNFGNNSYYNNIGTLLSLKGGVFDGPAYIMGAAYGGTVTLASIIDGTSNTAMFSENLKGPTGLFTAAGGPSSVGSLWIMSISITATAPASPNRGSLGTNLKYFTQTYCMGGNPTVSIYTSNGDAWIASGNGEGGGYSHVNTPNLRNCWGANQDSWTPDGYDGNQYTWGNMITAKSNHPGGVNMLFLDGSVKFLRNSVDPGAYGALGTMAGGEVIGSDAY